MLNDIYPDVRQYLLVPYAQPPVGDLRWQSPQKLKKMNRRFDSTRYGPACPQYVSSYDSIWTEYSPTALLYSLGGSRTEGSTAWFTAEKTVYPKVRSLDETSLTLLNVRAAVEWVYENIESFGGNKDNIMLWAQSQGAVLTHLYTLAFPDNPLATKFGILSQPPSVIIKLTTTADVYADFDIIAKALGCNYGSDAMAELECMRKVSWVRISEFIRRYTASPSISFSSHIPDEKYIFADEPARYAARKVAPGPAIRSNVDRESASTNFTAAALTEQE
ncbi:alpha/beta-hydrolase [Aspergillus homomorphus CBS 101889]|uniref:Alpha/beta-hydrolase n=1 Tax=Aspergillus homomorphus (strain CBS 101889) TaxID=1450537 RepID=A0A395HVB2_ASPHC|nr:alpha/beta-hydrolase [Aspergillus homomorphus CBS 101889]RAL11469.1 alpha/beta-hydrolase [Aspergillus homomorphus CBS 101889]